MGDLNRQSKFLSLVLRHKPEVIGIELDKNGWADVNEILIGMNISKNTLNKIVDTDSKGRYEYNNTNTKIRARQGHSIKVDVELEEKEPPQVLYHGTATKYLDSIMESGLKPMSRNYVHLSSDNNTAQKVGSRHGKPVVLKIDADKMYQDGYVFKLSRNNVWLVDAVPSQYISIQWDS